MPLLDDIATYIASQGQGTVKSSVAQAGVNWLIYKGSTPPGDRSDAISLMITVGGSPLETMGSGITGVVAEQPRFQILARNMDYSAATAKAELLWATLHGFSGTLGSTRYLRIEAQQSPFVVGRDDATRWMVGFNCIAWKERG